MTTAARKLQGEIDKLFKKVAEGMDEFDSIWNKFHSTEHSNQREKYEQDLKREIKKLQRYRDQIRTWIAGSEVKDKNPLMEQRRLIEVQMERFKALERELKTKAYSKEGLLAASTMDGKSDAFAASYVMNGKNDARVRARLDFRQWITDQMETLQEQMESYENELDDVNEEEEDQGDKRRSTTAHQVAERLSALQQYCETHRQHLSSLQKIIRLLDRDHMDLDALEAARDDIAYYVENHADPDFIENDALYNDLGLDHLHDKDSGDDHPQSDDNDAVHTLSEPEDNPQRPLSDVTLTHPPLSNPPSLPSPTPSKSAAVSTTTSAPLPSSTSSSSSSRASSLSSSPSATASSITPSPMVSPTTVRKTVSVDPPKKQPSSATAARGSSQSSQQTSTVTVGAPQQSPIKQRQTTLPFANSSQSHASSHVASSPITRSVWDAKALSSQGSSKTVVVASASQRSIRWPRRRAVLMEEFQSFKELVDPSLLQLAVPSNESVSESNEVSNQRDAYYYYPRHLYVSPVDEYPRQPLSMVRCSATGGAPPCLLLTDIDTLFYLFYYHAGTLLQLHAARALRDRGWLFHSKHLVWFQLNGAPNDLVYFDYEHGWCQRRRSASQGHSIMDWDTFDAAHSTLIH